MHFDEYQKQAETTAIYQQTCPGLMYPALGLAGEAGEVANRVKKVFRDTDGEIDHQTRLAIADEVGDVLWYCAALASELGLSLDKIAAHNLDKLSGRKARGRLKGSGDHR
jgi:NTP pyrophosphatase (non-canonical NTP hydrolase)